MSEQNKNHACRKRFENDGKCCYDFAESRGGDSARKKDLSKFLPCLATPLWRKRPACAFLAIINFTSLRKAFLAINQFPQIQHLMRTRFERGPQNITPLVSRNLFFN
jgi:hypothetical protein